MMIMKMMMMMMMMIYMHVRGSPRRLRVLSILMSNSKTQYAVAW